MNVKQIKQKNWRVLYYQYKDTQQFILATFVIAILVCVIVIITVIIPQVKNYLSLQKEAVRTQGVIQTIRSNTALLQQLPDTEVDDNFQTANKALPSEKDFVAVIAALYASSVQSGVALDDYTFSLDGKGGGSRSRIGPFGGTATSASLGNGISIDLTVHGGIQNIKSFISEVQQKLPLAEVRSIDGQAALADVSVIFYFKDYPKLSYTDTEALQTISGSGKSLLETLHRWDTANIGLLDASGSSASSSGSSNQNLFN